jgi:MFS family permease
MFGTGLLLVNLPLYFARTAHLSTAQLGIGLTVAATVTLLAGLPLGELADRKGPLEVAKPMLLVQCADTG